MMDDRDIWRTAQACVKHHRNDAAIHAAMRADELLERGDMDGAATWRRVIAAVKELGNTQPSGALH